MVEIDKTFTSRGQWLGWARQNMGVYDRTEADKIGARILAAGFVEPITGRAVAPDEIVTGNRNWREGLLATGMNSRIRAVLKLIEEALAEKPAHEVTIYATESVTPFADVLRRAYPRFVGSEYGVDDNAIRALLPHRHEDLLNLSFPDQSFDIVTTNEVLEHVPDLDRALFEIHRVLKPGGWHIGTHPFHFGDENGDLRAKLDKGKVVYLKPPELHGNPADPERGSLVFETPGWNILNRCRAVCFREPSMRFYASEAHGCLTENTGVFVLCAQR